MKKAKMKKIMVLMLLGGFIFITGCSNQSNISASQVIGGVGGAALGGMVGGMMGLLVTGGNPDGDAVLVTSLLLGAVAGGGAGIAVGTGVQTIIDDKQK